MSGAQRRVVLHVGMPKTGSSALQSAFVLNREALAELGIHYPTAGTDAEAAAGGTTSGNAAGLFAYLNGGQVRDPRPRIEGSLAETDLPITLFSCEVFFWADLERLAGLHRVVADCGARLEIVLFIRDLAPWLLSHYVQDVKRIRFPGDFGDFLDQFEERLRLVPDQLDAFVDELGRESVTVLHYDSHRRTLLDTFLAHGLGVDPTGSGLTLPGHVNRSMTAREIGWMRAVNARLDENAPARTVSDALLRRPTEESTTHSMTEADLARIVDIASAGVARINRSFFGGDETLAIGGSRVTVGPAASVDPTPDELILLEICADLAVAAHASSPTEQALARARVRLRNEQDRSRRLRARVDRLQARLAQVPTPPRASLPRRLLRRLRRL